MGPVISVTGDNCAFSPEEQSQHETSHQKSTRGRIPSLPEADRCPIELEYESQLNQN